jgi:uncharacterized protein YbaA (DUF1428 family)
VAIYSCSRRYGYDGESEKNLRAYGRFAQKAGKIFREYGALEFQECVGYDLNVKIGVPFPRMAKPKAGETVIFSWIAFKSSAQCDRVNSKVMRELAFREHAEAFGV